MAIWAAAVQRWCLFQVPPSLPSLLRVLTCLHTGRGDLVIQNGATCSYLNGQIAFTFIGPTRMVIANGATFAPVSPHGTMLIGGDGTIPQVCLLCLFACLLFVRLCVSRCSRVLACSLWCKVVVISPRRPHSQSHSKATSLCSTTALWWRTKTLSRSSNIRCSLTTVCLLVFLVVLFCHPVSSSCLLVVVVVGTIANPQHSAGTGQGSSQFYINTVGSQMMSMCGSQYGYQTMPVTIVVSFLCLFVVFVCVCLSASHTNACTQIASASTASPKQYLNVSCTMNMPRNSFLVCLSVCFIVSIVLRTVPAKWWSGYDLAEQRRHAEHCRRSVCWQRQLKLRASAR